MLPSRANARVVALWMMGIALFAQPAIGQSEVRPSPASAATTSTAGNGLDRGALDRLLERALETQSDALVIVKDGQLVGEWYFGKPRGPIEAMSATKSIVSLAIGRLLSDGRLESLDAPVHRFYREWNQGRKARITIRHLLTQRSGLQSEPITTEIYRSPDFVQLALAAELLEDPGTKFRYNNKACNLLAGIVQKAAGKRMDVLIGDEIFKPLGISDWSWSLDRAGNPHGMSGLQIHPADLTKIGRLMLDGGMWEGKRILPESFVAETVRDDLHPRADAKVEFVSELWGPHYGLLWWVNDAPQFAITDRLLDEWRRLKAPEEFVTKLAELRGVHGADLSTRAMEAAGGEEKWAAVTWQANRPDFDIVGWTSEGYSADGYLGQYLVVVPQHRLIAVRMRRSPTEEFDERRIDQFRDFKERVQGLVKR
jgi:CubicO group peptidase (beta-lactamase class C family)